MTMRLGVPVEVPLPEDGEGKRPRGRPPTVVHFHDDVSPTHFCKILMTPGIRPLPLPDAFRPFVSPVIGKMIVQTTIGCSWEMAVKEVSGKAVLEAGWPEFAIAHNIKIGYLLLFKKLTPKEYMVVVFDYSCCEVVGMCPGHAMGMNRHEVEEL